MCQEQMHKRARMKRADEKVVGADHRLSQPVKKVNQSSQSACPRLREHKWTCRWAGVPSFSLPCSLIQGSSGSWVLLALARPPGMQKETLSLSAVLFRHLERELWKKGKCAWVRTGLLWILTSGSWPPTFGEECLCFMTAEPVQVS